MTIRSAIIDHRALPHWPQFIAGQAMRMALDPYCMLRMQMGLALAPPKNVIYSLQPGMILVVEVEDGNA